MKSITITFNDDEDNTEFKVTPAGDKPTPLPIRPSFLRGRTWSEYAARAVLDSSCLPEAEELLQEHRQEPKWVHTWVRRAARMLIEAGVIAVDDDGYITRL